MLLYILLKPSSREKIMTRRIHLSMALSLAASSILVAEEHDYQSDKATDPVYSDKSKNFKKVARGGGNNYFMHPKIHNKKLEDSIRFRRYVRSVSRGRFAPGILNQIVGFCSVLAPAINFPVPNGPDDELVVPVE